MSLFASLRTRLFPSTAERELNDELHAHIEHRADDLERSGLPRPEAERRARIEFGGYERFRQESREALGTHFAESLLQDIRFGLRMMARKPGFTIVAVLTLAFAIGANAVAFSVMNGLVLRPLNVPQPRQLFMVEEGKHHFEQSYLDYLDIRDRTQAFSGVFAFDSGSAGLDAGDGPSEATLYETTGNYFDVLGIQPYLGRFYHAADEHGPNSAPYVILSYEYWKNRFQRDPAVVGRKVKINKYPYTILGVAQPRFIGTAIFLSTDIWVPLVNQAQVQGESHRDDRSDHELWIIGRLKPGLTRANLDQDLAFIAAWLAKTYPKSDEGMSFNLARPELMGDYAGAAARAFITGLMLLAALILVAACANLGSLFAARAADRAKEVALRLALGSSRKRIMRQLLTEATMVALAGGALGLAASIALLHLMAATQPIPDFPIYLPIEPDGTVYGVAVLLALVSGLLFGIVPIRQVLRSDPYQVIKSGTAETTRRLTLRDVLLAAQIAICAVLVTASLVAVRGLFRSIHSDFGFQTKNALVITTDLAMARYNSTQQPIMQKRMLDAVAGTPGVTAAAYADTLPLAIGQNTSKVYTDDTTDMKGLKGGVEDHVYSVSSDYFQAAGTILLAGRPFTLHDDSAAPHVAIINEQLARKVFGSPARALGGHFKIKDGVRIEVVGITKDGKYESLPEDPRAALFLPILQWPSSSMVMIVRSDRDPQRLTESLRTSIRALDPGLPFTMGTWFRTLDMALFPARIATMSLGVLGALGAMLSVTGIFGMAAWSVSKRLREFGIRIALGAPSREVLRAALGRTFRLLAFGSTVGLLLGLAAGKVLAFVVYQATPWDPVVLGGVLFTMLTLGLLAGWIPARRALATNPLILLREE